MRFVTEKDKEAVIDGLKPVYKAVNDERGHEKLLVFEGKWGEKHSFYAKSWLDNWVNISTFFEYDE